MESLSFEDYIKKMKKTWVLIYFAVLGSLWAGGEGELEFEKNWHLENRSIVEIKGELEVSLVWGETTSVKAQGPQGLVEQLYVSDWFDQVTISLEGGVGGPLDPGKVSLVVVLPYPQKLTALNGALVSWAEPILVPQLFLASRDKASLTGEVIVESLELLGTWMAQIQLKGQAKNFILRSNGEANLNLEELDVEAGELLLRESSRISLGKTGTWVGQVSSGARVLSPGPLPQGVELSTEGHWDSMD